MDESKYQKVDTFLKSEIHKYFKFIIFFGFLRNFYEHKYTQYGVFEQCVIGMSF